MADASIALNRFGLGARAGEPAPSSPKRWLLDQMARYEARPAQIARLPSSAAVSAELADYLEEVRAMGPQRRAPPTPRRPAGPRAPQLGEEGMISAAPAMSDSMEPGQAMPKAAPADPRQQARQFARRQGRDHYAGAVAARAAMAQTGPAPFVERLVHFWANHFAVSADKLTVIGLSGYLEFDAIRPHVLGSFRDMLHAVERHPAMLLYLDQAQSIGPNSAFGQIAQRRQAPRQPGLNENLAREILELHTLGVRTGYSQADVTEFARAMTGWTVAGITRGRGTRFAGIDGQPGDFIFAERLHEPGERTIIGKRYAQSGEAQAAAVLDDLAAHPATAKHLATKLARHFAGDEPPAALVGRIEAAYLKSGGDLPSIYRVLVESPECWVAQPVKFKTPWEWTISATRALGVQEMQPLAVTNLLNQLGQPAWRPGSPAGWDDLGASWAGPDAIMRRVEAAERLAGRSRDTIDARARAAELFPGALTPATAQAIARAESPRQGLALMLVAPEFMRR